MSARRAGLGIALSLTVHLGLLVVTGGWLARMSELVPERALAVAIWTELEPPLETEEPAEHMSAPTVETAEPAPAEVESDTPEAPIAIPEPPPEPARPDLPDLSEPGGASVETDLPISPLLGVLETPPAGPAALERDRILGERLSASERAAAERGARLEGRSRSQPVAGLERRGDTLMVPERDTPLASEKGVVGPLGRRHILYSEAPEYPAWARRQGLEADLRFRIWVTPEGFVGRIEVLERSGSAELDRLALEALRAWRFAPVPRGGTGDEWGEVPMTFTLITD